MHAEIKENYTKWSKGYEAYNATYNMPDFFPIHNLYLLNEVKIYKFEKRKKVDVTRKMKDYLALKRKVLEAVLKQEDLASPCKAQLQKTLNRLPSTK